MKIERGCVMTEMLSKAQKKALKAALAEHQMSYETGRCTCGVDLGGDYSKADEHFYEATFAAGFKWCHRRFDR